MKTKKTGAKRRSVRKAAVPRMLRDEDIAEYARHLYEQSGCIPGRDLDNWLEARACLEANIPKHESHLRLHRLRHRPVADAGAVSVMTVDAEGVPCSEAPEPAPGVVIDSPGRNC